MTLNAFLARACAIGAAAFAAGVTPALSHVVVGDRFFPATLLIDDPGVNDELSLPTFAYLTNPDGSQTNVFSFEYDKRITPALGISIEDGFIHQNNPRANGWDNLSTSLKYVLFINPEHEFMLSAGVEFEWGHTGAAGVGAEAFTSWSPQIFFGKGFGDLPASLNALRPFALTGQLGVELSTHPISTIITRNFETGDVDIDVDQDPTFFNWGFSLQYSLPYMNSNISAIDNDLLKRLIPLVEVSLSTPVANIGPPGSGNSHVTTGLVNPGVIYVGQTFQLGLEAQLPINSASGKHVGVIAQLHLYLDNIFPDSIGRPLFDGPASAF
ncbi:hypothetical protein [Methylocella silvestris]|uniref:Transporter n=1 Tax=Methylocella silvestris TaxID=199596 RepID=A0A2J7THX3_METSI|nr:hypothetical protein [Methylocella silvestris]PNG26363.1 hypothetical protein CR492_08100 [Methylocella silvestris]